MGTKNTTASDAGSFPDLDTSIVGERLDGRGVQPSFAAVAQTSLDALWIWDVDSGRVVFISQASERLTGLTPVEVLSQTHEECWANIHPADRAGVDAALAGLVAAKNGKTVEYEYRHRHRDKCWRWLRNRAGVFTRNPDGSAAQIFGHTEDVTARHAAADQVQATELADRALGRDELLESERAARVEAERANSLKDEFLATVSHELRTPLTAILGWTAMLSEHAQDPELRHGLDVINRNARAQRQLIEDLLDMSRIMSGKLRIEPQPVLLGEVVRSAIETVMPAAEARGVALVSEIDAGEQTLRADAERLEQIIWNLLSNAVKFTPAGGRVSVRAFSCAGEATISVADTGRGMRPEFLPHVFERFRQEDGATTRKAGGLGLGLAIVKRLVELHGGTISASSEGLGKGSVFTVRLPLLGPHRASQRGQQPGSVNSPDGAEADSDSALAGRRVLVIDDEMDTRSYFHRVLMEHGAHVTLAGNAMEGLRLALGQKPDAILCDIAMPGEDGYSFIRQLRSAEDRAIKEIPTVALTARAQVEDRQRALDAGFDEHCAKPVEPVELCALVARLLRGVAR